MASTFDGEGDIENGDFFQDDRDVFCSARANATDWMQESLLLEPVMPLLSSVGTVSGVGDGAGKVAFYYSALLALSFLRFGNRVISSIRTASHTCLSLDPGMENWSGRGNWTAVARAGVAREQRKERTARNVKE